MDGLIIGRIVHYVPKIGELSGEERPGIIVDVANKEQGVVSLQVFTDDRHDGPQGQPGLHYVERAHHSDTSLNAGTWHWSERA